ncbi:ribonuclease H family protein [Agrobacterium tumefaciens]
MIPYRYSIDTLSIYRDRDRDRDKTEKKTKTKKKTFYAKTKKSAAHSQQGLFALEGVKASRSCSQKRRSQKPKASKVDFSKGVHVFTDGACDPNPGPGGWAFVVYENGYAIHSESRSDAATTNNRMEMQAIIAALRWMQANAHFKAQVHTDSQYCVKGTNEWRHGWARKNWMRGENLIPNADLWQQLSAILDAFPASLDWVPGHYGIAGNEAADRLAFNALKCGLRERRAA